MTLRKKKLKPSSTVQERTVQGELGRVLQSDKHVAAVFYVSLISAGD